jgi:predicted DNA-binding transcriptional regulator
MYDIFDYLFPNNFKMRQSLIVFKFLVEAQGNFHRAVEVVKPGLLTHIKYSYTRASPDAIISCNCHGFNIIEIKCLLDVKLVSI